MYFVYILRSQKDKRHYIGLTTDVVERLKYHNAGQVKSTSHRRPFKLIYTEPHSSIAEAREREKFLKSYRGAKEKLNIIESIKGPIV